MPMAVNVEVSVSAVLAVRSLGVRRSLRQRALKGGRESAGRWNAAKKIQGIYLGLRWSLPRKVFCVCACVFFFFSFHKAFLFLKRYMPNLMDFCLSCGVVLGFLSMKQYFGVIPPSSERSSQVCFGCVFLVLFFSRALR